MKLIVFFIKKRIRSVDSASRAEGDLIKCPVCRDNNILPFCADLASYLRTDHDLLSLKAAVNQQIANSHAQPQPAASTSAVSSKEHGTQQPPTPEAQVVLDSVQRESASSLLNPVLETFSSTDSDEIGMFEFFFLSEQDESSNDVIESVSE